MVNTDLDSATDALVALISRPADADQPDVDVSGAGRGTGAAPG